MIAHIKTPLPPTVQLQFVSFVERQINDRWNIKVSNLHPKLRDVETGNSIKTDTHLVKTELPTLYFVYKPQNVSFFLIISEISTSTSFHNGYGNAETQ